TRRTARPRSASTGRPGTTRGSARHPLAEDGQDFVVRRIASDSAKMEMRPRSSMASVSQTLEERCELRRRSPLPRRELLRSHEERREVRLSLNGRKESGGLRMRSLAPGPAANTGDRE